MRDPLRRYEEARAYLARGGSAHLMGIGGVGVAGLARLLLDRGFRVTGCDTAGNALTRALAARGAGIRTGHDPAHLDPPPDWLIRTAAVPEGHPEVARARSLGIPVHARGEALAAVVAGARGIAVAGTHGKTTTTAMTVQILRRAGRDPAFAIGGEVAALGGVAGGGGRDGWLVVEADESDGTLSLYEPEIAIIGNVDFDHMEHFAGVEEFHGVFASAVARTRGTVCYGRDDEAAARICGARAGSVGFGFDARSDVRAERWESEGFAQRFDLVVDGRRRGTIRLPVPGRHNALDALGAIAASLAAGCPVEAAAEALAEFCPARRRMDLVFAGGGIEVYSDYAHHPAEIRALVGTAAGLPHRRLLAVFQPHRYTRTLALGPQFPAAFRGVDSLVLVPVYAASEAPLAGGTSLDLLGHFRGSETFAVEYAESLDAAWSLLRARLREGDVLLVVGAGDVEKIGTRAATELRARLPPV